MPLGMVGGVTNAKTTLIKEPITSSIPKAKKLNGSAGGAKPGIVKINPKLKNFGKKKKINPKMLLGVLFLVLLIIGGGVGLYLTKIKQDLRQQASSPDYAGNCRRTERS